MINAKLGWLGAQVLGALCFPLLECIYSHWMGRFWILLLFFLNLKKTLQRQSIQPVVWDWKVITDDNVTTLSSILLWALLQELQNLIHNEKLLSVFEAPKLPENTNLWNWALLKSLLQHKESYRTFLVNKCLNLHILQYFTVLATNN